MPSETHLTVGWARLIVLTLGDPHLLEGAQRGQDGSTNPHRVLALRWCHNLDLHGGWRQSGQFLGHPLTNACKHCGTSGKHNVGIQILPDVYIALHDGLEGSVMDTRCFLADEAWLEEHLWASEALTSHCDDVSIRQFICLLLVRALSRLLHLSVEVQSNVRQLLLDIPDNLPLSRGGERIPALRQDFHHVLSEVAACQVQAADSMWQGIPFIDRHGVGHAIA